MAIASLVVTGAMTTKMTWDSVQPQNSGELALEIAPAGDPIQRTQAIVETLRTVRQNVEMLRAIAAEPGAVGEQARAALRQIHRMSAPR